MANYKRAVDTAKNPEKPRRAQLLALYDQYMIDGHLSGNVSKLKNKVLAEPFVVVDENGKEDPDALKLFLRPWFYDFNSTILDTELYGHTLVNFDYPDSEGDFKGEFTRFDIIPREHVVPELGQVLLSLKDEVGLPFREGGDFTKLLLEIGKPDNLGLLMKVGPDITWKRHARNDWARRSEKYGQPLVNLKTEETDDDILDKKEAMLQNLGSNGYIITDIDEELDLLEVKDKDGHLIYKEIGLYSNDEISKLLTGQTMTSDAAGGQYKGEVHERVEEHFIQAKMRYMYFYWNFTLLPFLKDWGYPLQGKFIKWRKWIDEENERGNGGDGNKKKPDPETDPKKGKEEKEALNFNQPHSLGGGVDSCCGQLMYTLSAKSGKRLLQRTKALAALLHANPDKQPIDFLESKEWKAVQELVRVELFSAVEDGFGKGLAGVKYNSPDYLFLKKMEQNVFIFSAFKNYQLLMDLNGLLKNEQGELRPWNSFKKEALLKHEEYNVQHLAAEYNTAVASGQGAAKWQKFQENKEYYFLKVTTAGDNRVRGSHRKFEGITLPPDHDFWKTHWIPFDWQCRCNIIRVPRAGREATDITALELPALPKMFSHNTGITGVVFPESHQYFDVNGQEIHDKIRRAA
ncbi:phage portal protein family protein [Rufibacter quisquiliarum]|uniref:SPP1 gp7 family putative phage head morphogenesis protein n=1 Tax=Rufibacter quisquiliarum TaxID=1549639 RepID=A0A839GH18_9BACT|nr:DUF935 family protein [Rufibacter quisquiliarum]MBA9078954.1 SPP1 gp7 family putative phage head morphogenesis protein [Rufibacter quisquiliarum]